MRKLLLLLFLFLLPACGFAQKVNLPTQVRGILPCPNMPALSGDVTTSSGSCTTTILPTFALRNGVQQQSYIYSADTGGANAYVVTLSPAPTLVAGSEACFLAANGNTGASTLAVNGGSAKAIKKNGSSALNSGDIAAGQIVCAIYDGANFQLTSPPVSGAGTVTTSGTPAANQVALFSASTAVTGTATDSTTTHALFATAGAPAFRALQVGDLPVGFTAFSNLTSSTNTTAALVVGSGSSLTFSGSGTNNASSLLSGTWAIPGTIGITTPNTGKFSGLTLSGITGSTQCIHVNTSGVTSGTGEDCGPGGSNTQILFNNSGAFGADSTFIFNSTSKSLASKNSLTSNQPIIDCMSPVYGCKGDGSTNDSVAIQAAEAAMHASGGCVVFEAGHNFVINAPIQMNDFDCFKGISNSVGNIGSALTCATACFVYNNPSPAFYLEGITIENLEMIGGTNPIDIAFGNQNTFRDLELVNYSGCGIATVVSERMIIDNYTSVHNSVNGFAPICGGDTTKSIFSGTLTPDLTYGMAYPTINNMHEIGDLNNGAGHYASWAYGYYYGNGIANAIIHNMSCEFSGNTGLALFGAGTNAIRISEIDGMHVDTCGNNAAPAAIGVHIAGEVDASRISGFDPGFNTNYMTVEMQFDALVTSSSIENSWFDQGVDNSTKFALKFNNLAAVALINDRGGLWAAGGGPEVTVIGGFMLPSNLFSGSSPGTITELQLADSNNDDVDFVGLGRFDAGLPYTASFNFIRNINTGGSSTYENLLQLNNLNATFTHHLKTAGAAPTCTLTSGGGSSPSCTVDTGSSDVAGAIKATTGTGSPAGTGTITLIFNAAMGTNKPVCLLMASDAGSAWASLPVFKDLTPSTSSDIFTWTNGTSPTALSTSSTYWINYQCWAK